MHDDSHRGCFTLVNVAVGVGCLLLMAALLLPRVGSHPPGMRNVCSNNARQVALAMINFETARRYYPGSANGLGNRTTSYIVPILPYLERTDIYKVWADPASDIDAASQYLDMLICPAAVPPDGNLSPGEKSAWLNYVVNSAEANQANAADGICFDLTAANPLKVSLSDVISHDGSEYTLLLTENVQAWKWTSTTTATARNWTTFVWHKDAEVEPAWRINGALPTRNFE